MPYIGNNQVAGVHQNNFKILDDISSYTETFDGSSSSVVNTTNNTITVSQHRFYHGQRVTYNNGGGGNIGGLTSGTVYYAVADSHSTIKLAASEADALSNTVINLSSVGSGSAHTLNNSFDGVNKKFKLTHSGGNGVNLTNASHATVAINNVVQRPNLNDSSFTEGFAIEGGKNIVFKTAPTSTDTFWGNTIAEAVGTFDTTDHVIDTFTADGTTTNFSLTKIPPSIRDIHITLDGVTQHTSAFSLQANVLIFTTAPANGTAIQVKHMGFVGASISGVTGFYGRIGNVSLQDGDILRGDGSLISGIESGVPGISTTGTSTFNSLNVTGVSTFASTFNYFGPKDSGTNEHGISLIYNSGTGLLTFHDQSGDGYIRSYSELFFLVEADQSTGYIGGGYGLRMTNGFSDTPPGSLIPYTINQGLPNLGRPAARFGTLFSEQVNISGVSTFSGPVSIGGTTHFNNQSLFFGPVLNNGEISIDLVDNGIAATFDHNDTSGLGLFIRTGSDLYLLADHKTSTNSNGDGYGLIIQSGSGNIIPSHDYKPQLGLSNREFGTLFTDQLNISGVSTFTGNVSFASSIGTPTNVNINVGSNDELQIRYNGNLGTIDMYDDQAFCMAIRSASDLILRGYFGDNTPALGDGYGLDITNSHVCPATLGYNLGNSTNKFATVFANGIDVGIVTATNYQGVKVEQGYATNSSLSGTFNYDFANGHVQTYMSSTSGNYTPNFRVDSSTTLASKMSAGGNSGVGDVVSATLFVTSSSHYCGSSVQVDGTTTNVTTEWVGGSSPSSANGSGYDIYSFTIVKTAVTPAYTVFANAIAAA